jgi:hypothetical protein
MAPPHGAERLVTARSEVKRACDLLIAASPEGWDGCEEALQHAVSKLGDIDGDARTRSEVRGLRGEVLRAARLLESLADFYRGWERILGAMSAGYTAHGDPAAVVRHGRVYCRG